MKTYLLRAGLLFLLLSVIVQPLISQSGNELLEKGGKWLNEGKYQQAIEAFRVVIDKNIALKPRAYFLLGIVYERIGNFEKAAESFTNAMELNYNRKAAELHLIQALKKLGKIERARDLLISIKGEIDPLIFIEGISQLYLIQGDYQKARELLEDYSRTNPKESTPISILCAIALRENNLGEMRKHLNTLMKLDLTLNESIDDLLTQLENNGFYEDAEKLLKRLFKMQPNDPRYYEKLTQLILKQGKDINPEIILPSDVMVNDQHLMYCLELAKKYEATANPTRSVELLERIVHQKPEFSPARLELLEIYYKLGYDQKGIQLIEDPRITNLASRSDTQSAEWWYTSAKFYVRTLDQEKCEKSAQNAVAFYKKKISDQPDSLIYSLRLSLSYILTGDLSNADGQLQKYMAIGSFSDRAIAKDEFQKLIDEKIMVQDVTYLSKKYFIQEDVSIKTKETVVAPPVTIQRDVTPPEIIILSPQPTRGILAVQADSYMCSITGLASDSQGVSIVYIGGMNAQLSEPSQSEIAQYYLPGKVVKFTGDGMLAPGNNTIEIRAIDLNGNVAKKTITIQRNMTVTPVVAHVQKLPAIWAVIIGISQYEAKDLRLEFADRDAQAIYGLLKSPYAGAVPDDHITFLTNRNATRAEVLRSMNEKLRLAFEDDEVIIYLACHGVPDEVTNELYFLCYDSQAENIIGTGISQLDIQKAISAARAKKVLLIVDACHSGSIGLAPSIAQRGSYATLTNKLLQELAQVRDGVAILSASSASEFSRKEKRGKGTERLHILWFAV